MYAKILRNSKLNFWNFKSFLRERTTRSIFQRNFHFFCSSKMYPLLFFSTIGPHTQKSTLHRKWERERVWVSYFHIFCFKKYNFSSGKIKSLICAAGKKHWPNTVTANLRLSWHLLLEHFLLKSQKSEFGKTESTLYKVLSPILLNFYSPYFINVTELNT